MLSQIKIKKREILSIVFLIFLLMCGPLSPRCLAQQKDQFTQYSNNNFLINPAVAGIERFVDLRVAHRQQWIGLDNAPVTSVISLNTAFNEDNSKDEEGNDIPASKSEIADYKASAPHHAFGFYLASDKAGIYSRTDLSISYAYHLSFSERLNIAAGIGTGSAFIGVNRNKMQAEDMFDPALNDLAGKQRNPLLSFGLWLYGPRLYLGVSATQLLAGKSKLGHGEGATGVALVPHYYAVAGYRLFLAEDISVLPSVLVTKSETVFSGDVNMKVFFKDRFIIGGGFRRGDSFSALAGLNINSLLNVNYSYDFTTSRLEKVSSGSHEVVLGIRLNNKNKSVGTRY